MTKCKDCKYLETKNYRRHLKKDSIYFCKRPEMTNKNGVEVLIESDLDKECPYGF